MDFLKVKEWFSKAWKWSKAHWAVFLAVFVGVFAIVFTANRQKAIKDLYSQLQTMGENHRKDMENITKEYQAERVRRENIERTYQETLARIESEKRLATEELNRKKKTELKKIIEEVGDDPDEMARRVNSLFGIKIDR